MCIDVNNYATINIDGTKREVCLDIIDEQVSLGDYVLCHAEHAIHKVGEALAQDKLALLWEIL